MIFVIIYWLGVLAGVLCAIDTFHRTDIGYVRKAAISLLCCISSWPGFLYYVYIYRFLQK